MNTKEKTVCFSGHRVLHDPQKVIEQQLVAALKNCISNGKNEFITGGAIGFDVLAAKAIIALRKEYPTIRLVLALPCPFNEQSLKWNAQQKAEGKSILEQADDVKILSPHYTDGCMLSRNRFMVDNSTALIYYLRSDHGGTKYTVEYAKKKGIALISL